MGCPICRAPDKHLWIDYSGLPRAVTDVRIGRFISVASCPSCATLWFAALEEPYASWRVAVRWPYTIDDWERLERLDSGRTLNQWFDYQTHILWPRQWSGSDNNLTFIATPSNLYYARDAFSQHRVLGAWDLVAAAALTPSLPGGEYVVRRLRAFDKQRRWSLDDIARDITTALAAASSSKDRMRLLVEDWQLVLPVASTILWVLWPDDFFPHDSSVAVQVGVPDRPEAASTFEEQWAAYQRYVTAVGEFLRRPAARGAERPSLRVGSFTFQPGSSQPVEAWTPPTDPNLDAVLLSLAARAAPGRPEQ